MIGTYGDILFRVDSGHVMTPQGITRSAGSDWAQHDPIGAKSKSEYVRPSLRSVSYTIRLDSQLGVRPRAQLERLAEMAEGGYIGFFVIGGRPMARNPMKLVSVSEAWGTVYSGGELANAEVSLELEEYV